MTRWAGSRVGMWAAAAVISGKTDRPCLACRRRGTRTGNCRLLLGSLKDTVRWLLPCSRASTVPRLVCRISSVRLVPRSFCIMYDVMYHTQSALCPCLCSGLLLGSGGGSSGLPANQPPIPIPFLILISPKPRAPCPFPISSQGAQASPKQPSSPAGKPASQQSSQTSSAKSKVPKQHPTGQ